MMYRNIAIENILVNEDDNYRKEIDESSIQDLYKTFKSVEKRTNGNRWMLNPVDVVKLPEPIDGKEYRLRFGFRRLLAARYGLDKSPTANAYMGKIPCFVVENPEDEEAGAERLLALVENLQREDVHVLDEAIAIQKTLDDTHNTMKQLGKELGRSKAWISQRLSLLSLPDEVQALLREDKISFGHARQLNRLSDDPEAQVKMADLIDMNDWDVRTSKDHIDKLLKGEPSPQTKFIADGLTIDTSKNDDKSGGDDEDDDGDDKSGDGGGDAGGESGGTSKEGKQTVGTIRPAKSLTEKVKDLSDRVESAERLRKAADPQSRPKHEKRSVFYAGAQQGIAWALGQLDDVEYEDLFDDGEDEEAAE